MCKPWCSSFKLCWLLYHLIIERWSSKTWKTIVIQSLQDVYTVGEVCMTRDPIYQGRHSRMQLPAWVACGQVIWGTVTWKHSEQMKERIVYVRKLQYHRLFNQRKQSFLTLKVWWVQWHFSANTELNYLQQVATKSRLISSLPSGDSTPSHYTWTPT